jgi:hypothetical protein
MAKNPASAEVQPPAIVRGLYIEPSPDLSIFSARRNSGKTHLITHLLSRAVASNRYNMIMIMCPTSFNGHYQQYTNKIIPGFSEKVINNVIKKQRKILEAGEHRHVLLVLDDCVGHSQFKSPQFELLASQGRHYRISVWITTQHLKKMPPIVRNNADYLYLLGKQTAGVLKTIFEEFGVDFGTPEKFANAVRMVLKNYGVFCINNLKQTFHELRAPSEIPGFRF